MQTNSRLASVISRLQLELILLFESSFISSVLCPWVGTTIFAVNNTSSYAFSFSYVHIEFEIDKIKINFKC